MKNALLLVLCVLCGCTGAPRPVEDSDTEEDVTEDSHEESDVLEEPEVSEDTVPDEAEEDTEDEEVFVPDCVEDSDCEDGDPCTVDYCEDFECWADDLDEDDDGYISSECGGTDCDDTDPTVWVQECEGINPCCDGCTDQGCWYDDTTGYLWEPGAMGTVAVWEDAFAYCEALIVAGRDNWEVPTISVLRTLIRGCPQTEDGGLCAVIDTCLFSSCSADCGGCSELGGPATDGTYQDPALSGISAYWSSSEYGDDNEWSWSFHSNFGRVAIWPKVSAAAVRCVSR